MVDRVPLRELDANGVASQMLDGNSASVLSGGVCLGGKEKKDILKWFLAMPGVIAAHGDIGRFVLETIATGESQCRDAKLMKGRIREP